MRLKKNSTKRRAEHPGPVVPQKRQKREVQSLEELPWKTISRPSFNGRDGDDGIIDLEEIDDVEVVYEDTPNGRVAKFCLPKQNSEDEINYEDEEWQGIVESDDTVKEEGPKEPQPSSFDAILLPDWEPFSLDPLLLSSIHRQSFTKPTPIQSRALPPAMAGKDVIGIAQTGSGKTLAYGLPILQHLLSRPAEDTTSKRKMKALVLAPTRELALQVCAHLRACIDTPSSPSGPKSIPRVSVATIVGGMSVQKQRRVVERGVDVLIATPGRLWDLLGEDGTLAEQMKDLKFLVLDEADRMIETGHFAELDNIIRLTLRDSQNMETDTQNTEEGADNFQPNSSASDLQTFIFSATLSKDLQRNLKRSKRKGGKHPNASSTLDDLLLKLDFRDPDPEVIDISPKSGMVETLSESQVECMSADKDVYLYYFLLRHPGRSLIFLSSIDGIRRLLPLLQLLQLPIFPLHSQLQQKQRLKNLDRFKSTPNSILLATDIAARGLDIPAIDHVIHYQIPRSTDVYVHRNGRTARAERPGFSLIMCAPSEKRVLRALLGSLDRLEKNEIPEMDFELDLLDKLKVRVDIARKIETAQHRIQKEKHDKSWMQEAADALEVQVDSDGEQEILDDDGSTKLKSKSHDTKIEGLKAELKAQLSRPLFARGVMKNYITSGSRSIVNELLAMEQGPTGPTKMKVFGFPAVGKTLIPSVKST